MLNVDPSLSKQPTDGLKALLFIEGLWLRLLNVKLGTVLNDDIVLDGGIDELSHLLYPLTELFRFLDEGRLSHLSLLRAEKKNKLYLLLLYYI